MAKKGKALVVSPPSFLKGENIKNFLKGSKIFLKVLSVVPSVSQELNKIVFQIFVFIYKIPSQ